jgi:dihydroorotase
MVGYNFIIRNGMCLDFLSGRRDMKDIYTSGGKIVASESELDRDCPTHEVNADGAFVLPGLIDEHNHVYQDGSYMGAGPDAFCLPSGVTCAVDAGTVGWANCELFFNTNSMRFLSKIYSYLNVSAFGVHDGVGRAEDLNPTAFNEKQIIDKFQKYPNIVRGLKIRMDMCTLDNYGILPLIETIKIADKINSLGYHCVVAVHCANLPQSVHISDIVSILRSGDVLAHVFQNRGETIFNPDGTIIDSVLEGRKRGVLFDCCTGRIHWTFDNYKKALGHGFFPDIISSDIVRDSMYIRPGFSLLHAMNVLFATGMEIDKIFEAVTITPARTLGIPGGTLEVGKPADIAILKVFPNKMHYEDRFGGSLTANEQIVPMMTFLDGEVVYRQIYF